MFKQSFPRISVIPEPPSAAELNPQIDAPVRNDIASRVIARTVSRELEPDALPAPYDVSRHHAAATPEVQLVTPEPAAVTANATPVGVDADGIPLVDISQLRTRDIAREAIRARFMAIGERRERRSAWEIAFLMLTAAIAMLLTAPPLVQILLAANGIEA